MQLAKRVATLLKLAITAMLIFKWTPMPHVLLAFSVLKEITFAALLGRAVTYQVTAAPYLYSVYLVQLVITVLQDPRSQLSVQLVTIVLRTLFSAMMAPDGGACFFCGSQAEQSEEGQDICVCHQKGEIFQPSDSHCTCALRHRLVSKGTRACVRKLYNICRDGTSRNQDGVCLTNDEWKEYCSLKVCASPVDYQGFDRVLGLCLCQAQRLDSVCNWKCRQLQWSRLQIACERGAQFRITFRDGSKSSDLMSPQVFDTGSCASRGRIDVEIDLPLKSIGRVLNSRNVIEGGQCHQQQPVHLVEMSDAGFLGVYDPDPMKLKNLLEMNLQHHPLINVSPDNATSRSPGDPEPRWSRKFVDSTTNGILFFGIFNPTTCIHLGSIILFTVSCGYYPVYNMYVS
ncbi:hypothetical protein chiPu_0001543 [Chiloscyllium punctatum]|uniref:Uncharacterized protein n=1 Tax=Chiloscyllium punctatum TaxID=137246 RepID=A0A401RYF6_CHIPU|nr:hypothetical protein [Chiloscyllium punctatum]